MTPLASRTPRLPFGGVMSSASLRSFKSVSFCSGMALLLEPKKEADRRPDRLEVGIAPRTLEACVGEVDHLQGGDDVHARTHACECSRAPWRWLSCCRSVPGAPRARRKWSRCDPTFLLYGDYTEFRNPFREGETIFGAAARVFADIELNPRVRVSLGAFGNQRFGSENAFERARPVISLTVVGRRSSFVFGTFPALPVTAPAGPD